MPVNRVDKTKGFGLGVVSGGEVTRNVSLVKISFIYKFLWC